MRHVVIAATLLATLTLALAPLGLGQSSKGDQKSAAKDRPKEITNSLGMKLVWIPPGKFLMGSPKEEIGRGDDEGPQHQVQISKGFYMGIYTVTQEEYQKLMGKNVAYFRAGNGGQDRVEGKDTRRYPVEFVNWADAKEFCQKLSTKEGEGKIYRLPTEAEWEYACRAGTTTPFHFGATISTEQANYNGDYIYGNGKVGDYLQRTVPVGSYPANAFGLHDMHGNVMQWCEDWYDGDYYANSPATDPVNTKEGEFRVLRGGSFGNDPKYCRSAYRFNIAPDDRHYVMGFRVVLSLP